MTKQEKIQKANQIRRNINKLITDAQISNSPVDYDVLKSFYNELEKLEHKGSFVSKFKGTGLKFNLGV